MIADDLGRGRISAFDLEGITDGPVSLRSRSGNSGIVASGLQAIRVAMSPDVVIGILPDRTLFTRDAAFWRTQGFWRQDHAYALRTVDGDTRASLSKHPGPQTFSGGNYTQGNTVYCTPLRHPFSQTTHTRSGEIWRPLGRTEAYEIKAYRSDGSHARIVRRNYEPRTPTQAEQNAHFRKRVARLPEERGARIAEVAPNLPLVDAFPAFAGTVGDALGHLWVAEFERPGEQVTRLTEYYGTSAAVRPRGRGW